MAGGSGRFRSQVACCKEKQGKSLDMAVLSLQNRKRGTVLAKSRSITCRKTIPPFDVIAVCLCRFHKASA